MPAEQAAQFDYVVVGSGGGGGPVAANLASAGFKVLLIEAGYEYKDLNYDVPAFHSQATQDPEMRWDFYVQHYSDPARQSNQYDSKYVPGKGVLYPRAGTLGGCTGTPRPDHDLPTQQRLGGDRRDRQDVRPE